MPLHVFSTDGIEDNRIFLGIDFWSLTGDFDLLSSSCDDSDILLAPLLKLVLNLHILLSLKEKCQLNIILEQYSSLYNNKT